MKEFQEVKNKVEFVNIFSYSEAVSDLYGQLVSWAYMRERDLMYLQLAYQYLRLKEEGCISKDSGFRKISGENIPVGKKKGRSIEAQLEKEQKRVNILDGAILYQILAMYTHSLPLYGYDEEGNLQGMIGSAGPKVGSFISGYCNKVYSQSQKNGNPEQEYVGGLLFFEITENRKCATDTHADYTNFRNEIDHFYYFTYHSYSLLDMYSIMYNRFLSYNRNLKKSVSFILQNILLGYFVNASFSFERGENELKMNCLPVNTKIAIQKMESEIFIYKLTNQGEDKKPTKANEVKERSKVYLKARNQSYIEGIKRILLYRASENEE